MGAANVFTRFVDRYRKCFALGADIFPVANGTYAGDIGRTMETGVFVDWTRTRFYTN